MYKGDVPRLLLALLCLVPAAAAAGSLPRAPGMYAQQGTTALPMLDSKIAVSVRGPVIETEVTQTFRNDSNDVTEATYIFPLPADAAVSAMAIDLGARKIHAAVEKRAAAQARYEEAVAAGMSAGLLEQERPDVFTQTVSAIPAHGTIIVTLRYDAVAHYADGTWELVVPLVVAPRFVPGTPSGRPTTGSGHNPDTDRAPDASRVTPRSSPAGGGSSEIAIAFATEVESVTSPSHDLAPGARYLVRDPRSDHDLIVRWHAKLPIQGWVEAEPNGAGVAAALISGPPATSHAATSLRFAIDRAATTRGDGDAVERALVRALLDALGPNDRAGLETGELRDAHALQRQADDGWKHSSSSFDLTRTLERAKRDVPLVLLSDGLVADDAAAIAAAKALGVPVHVIGIGAAPNRSLLTALATATNGTVRFATAGDDLHALAANVVFDAATRAPALAISWGALAASDQVPAHLPRIGAGQATLVLARVQHAQAANARADGDVLALASFTASRAPSGATTPSGMLARRWARLKLEDLIAGKNARAITEHALAWGLVSPYTSMVALGDEVVVEGGVKHTRGVPVSLPAGMQWQPVKNEVAVTGGLDARKETKFGADEKDPKDSKDPKDEPRAKTPPNREQAPAAPKTEAADKKADDAESTDDDRGVPREEVEVAGAKATAFDSISEGRYTNGHYLRLDLALGAGIADRDRDATFVAMLRLGVERGDRVLHYGGEASLWIDGSGDAAATLLGTLGRGLSAHFDATAGLGVHLGPGVGPAADAMLRYAVMTPLWLYLRYDGALLFHADTRSAEHAGTVGIEAHF